MAIDAGKVFVSINSIDLSSKCTSAPAVEQSREEVDITAFGDLIRKMQATIEAASELAFEFNQDFAGGSVHATLQALFASKAAVAIDLRPDNAARSATNPSFTFNAYVSRYAMMNPTAPGQTVKASCTLRRATSVTVATS